MLLHRSNTALADRTMHQSNKDVPHGAAQDFRIVQEHAVDMMLMHGTYTEHELAALQIRRGACTLWALPILTVKDALLIHTSQVLGHWSQRIQLFHEKIMWVCWPTAWALNVLLN